MKNPIKQTRRPYIVNFNLSYDAKSRDILKAYILGRFIDMFVQLELAKPGTELNKDLIKKCIRRAEWKNSLINFDKDIEKQMNEAGWSLDFIYLDQTLNRF